MPNFPKRNLLDRIVSALWASNWNCLQQSADAHPFELTISRNQEVHRLRVYIWNITHGGRGRSDDEYRIQVTGAPRFEVDGSHRTVVLGWWEGAGVFAGWDVTKHLGNLGASPSLQVSRRALLQAASNQVATYRKSNDEIVLSFVPSFLGEYLTHAAELHALAVSDQELAALEATIEHAARDEEITLQAPVDARRVLLKSVAVQLRDSSFSDRVLTAYGDQCAVCGIQLQVLDAAHILPAANIGDDSTSNGIALCALHHRAFDRALITLLPNYAVAYNPARLQQLTSTNEHGGWDRFVGALRPQIVLPPDGRDRPNPDRVNESNRVRGWTAFELIA